MASQKPRKTVVLGIELAAIMAMVCVLALIALPLLRDNRLLVAHRSCTDNLKQWNTIFSMYAHENNYFYPNVHGLESFGPADSLPACANINEDFDWSPNLRLIFPEYATDLGLLVCPDGPYLNPKTGDPNDTTGEWWVDEEALGVVRKSGWKACDYEGTITNGDLAYTYLGWRVSQDDDLLVDPATAREFGLPASGPAQIVALIWHVDPDRPEPDPLHRRAHPVSGGRRFEDVDATLLFGSLGPPYTTLGDRGILPKLWKGWYYIENAGTVPAGGDLPVRPWHVQTPIMWDTIRQNADGTPDLVHGDPAGANVLFMDGHVEFVAYPGKFPVSESYVALKYLK